MLLDNRRIITAAAVACFIAAIALTPSEVRSRLAPSPAVDAAPVMRADEPMPIVVAQRDPFIARVAEPDPAAAPASAPPAPAFSLDRIGPLPPNAGAGRLVPPAALAGAVRVRAVIVGPRPSALVDDGATTRLVTVGDAIAGTHVRAIDAAGITLDDARRLTLPAITVPAS